MKHLQKITAVILAVLMLITIIPISVFATETNTEKEEVVYINLNADGSVKEIYVVNIFELDENGKIVDYGEYTELRNMTTTDKIGYKDNKVTIDAKAGKLYYEGRLKENVMPWDISIGYYLDGKEYSANKIAGKSGKLEIKLSVKENADCDSSFFEGYALQTTITLNTDLATNITASGATVANVGKNKQLTYTILPNSEKDISVLADVEDFEMSAISANGIRMNLDIDINDAVMGEKTDEIVGAVSELNSAAVALNSGAKDLHSATGELNTAVGNLHSGVGSLSSGADGLKSGLDLLANKNNELTSAAFSAYEGLCTAAQMQLNAQFCTIGLESVTLTPDTYADVLLGILAQINDNTALAEVTAQVEALKGQLDSYGAFYNGLLEYTKGVASAKDGVDKLSEGISSLCGNTDTLKKAVGDLHIAVGTLKDGTQEFADKTADIEVSDEIDSVISSLTGEDIETVSFVSQRNTNIKSVQFVIQTEAIEIDNRVENTVAEAEQLTFWQKLLRLFGLY